MYVNVIVLPSSDQDTLSLTFSRVSCIIVPSPAPSRSAHIIAFFGVASSVKPFPPSAVTEKSAKEDVPGVTVYVVPLIPKLKILDGSQITRYVISADTLSPFCAPVRSIAAPSVTS